MIPEWIESGNVSRETMDHLAAYHDLLVKWTPKINLISKSSVSEIWDRHIWDSAQVYLRAPNFTTWLDIGSGGGLPGLIVAIMAKQSTENGNVLMIESDQRKSAFLRTVIRELDLNASVVVSRAETTKKAEADVISARALADLSELLRYAQQHLAPDGIALFLKGESWQKEVASAKEKWSFSIKSHTSKTNPAAALLEIKDIERV